MTSCQWPNPRRLTQVLRCDYPPPLFPRGATMRSFFWIGLSLCIFTVCTKSALAHRPNLSSARDQAAALQSEPVGGPISGHLQLNHRVRIQCDGQLRQHGAAPQRDRGRRRSQQSSASAGRLETIPSWLAARRRPVLATFYIHTARGVSRRPSVVVMQAIENRDCHDTTVSLGHSRHGLFLQEALVWPSLVVQVPIRMITRRMSGGCSIGGIRCTDEMSLSAAARPERRACFAVRWMMTTSATIARSRYGCSTRLCAPECVTRRSRMFHGRRWSSCGGCSTTPCG